MTNRNAIGDKTADESDAIPIFQLKNNIWMTQESVLVLVKPQGCRTCYPLALCHLIPGICFWSLQSGFDIKRSSSPYLD